MTIRIFIVIALFLAFPVLAHFAKGLQFLMTSGGTAKVLSDAEKAAISAARIGGIRAGTTRPQPVAAGLVRP